MPLTSECWAGPQGYPNLLCLGPAVSHRHRPRPAHNQPESATSTSLGTTGDTFQRSDEGLAPTQGFTRAGWERRVQGLSQAQTFGSILL